MLVYSGDAMNRREAITNLATTLAAASYVSVGAAQTITIPTSPDASTLAERKKQYAICKERGHVPAAIQTQYAIYFDPSQPQSQVCKYCGCHFRFVTTLEETNVPK